MRRYRLMISVLGVLLTGCSQIEVKENLGLTREPPDEFRVVSRPPLSVPREFFLTPPTPGAERAFGLSADAKARDIVTGGRSGEGELSIEERQNALADSAAPIVNSAPLASPAEEGFLKRAGTSAADPAIRETIAREQALTTRKEPDMIDRLRGEGAGEPVVDAAKEKERLQENKKKNKSVTSGEVPVKDPKEKSTLERIFN